MARPLNQVLLDGWERVLLSKEIKMIDKKIIIYPQWKGSKSEDFLYYTRAMSLAQNWKKDFQEHKKDIGFNHGIIYSYKDPDDPMTFYVYETKTAIIVKPSGS